MRSGRVVERVPHGVGLAVGDGRQLPRPGADLELDRCADALEGGLGEVVIVATRCGHMQRQARAQREGLEKVGDERGREGADRHPGKRKVDHGVATTAGVQRHRRATLVERHDGVTETGDPGAVAERLGQRLAEHDRDIFDGVVGVDLEVARRHHLEVDAPMNRKRAQQMVEEGEAGRDLGRAMTIQPESHRDVGLLRPPAPGRRPRDLEPRRRFGEGLPSGAARRHGCAVGRHRLRIGQRDDDRFESAQPTAVQVLHLERAAEGLDTQGAEGAARAAGRQHVVRPGRVIRGGGRRPGP